MRLDARRRVRKFRSIRICAIQYVIECRAGREYGQEAARAREPDEMIVWLDEGEAGRAMVIVQDVAYVRHRSAS